MSNAKNLKIGELACNRGAQTVVPLEASVKTACSAMHSDRSSQVFVIDKNGRLCASLSKNEVEYCLSTAPDSILSSIVQDAQNKPFRVITTDIPIEEVFRIMRQDNIEVLPVVDSGETLQGFAMLDEVRQHLSPERIYPTSIGSDDLEENVERHVARYRFASQFIRSSDVVLDCACGAAYGSAILAEKAAHIISVDRSSEAIHFALDNYARDNVEFRCQDINQLSFEKESLNAVVSLETLEHLPPDVGQAYMKGIGDWLKPNGILFASSPMLRYRDGKPYVTNPYHINEMPRATLLTFIESTFPNFIVQFFHQDQNSFQPLDEECTGFCIIVARKRAAR